jgi:hypothetical protein
MQIIGCDLHARQQTVAMLDTATGEVVKMTLTHEGNKVREFYSTLALPVRVGIEATGSMQSSASIGYRADSFNPKKLTESMIASKV